MVYSLTWLPQVLRGAGLKVEEVTGWQSRGRAEMGAVKGIICHHTAGPKTGNAPSLNIVVNGRSDLPGPLSQLVLGRDGTFYVVAAGRTNHAGAGVWERITDGNGSFIGIEAENTGLSNDSPWPEVQMDAYAKGVAAILKHIGAKPVMAAGHKEYALPKGRKPDPSFDMPAFRARVAAHMGQPFVTVKPNLFEAKAPKIMADLIADFGLTDIQAAGILGNIGHECAGFSLMQEQKPTSGKGGYGWCQWTGIRRTQFFAWCKANNLSVDSDAGNYGFLKQELKTTEKAAIPALKKAQTVYEAMLSFENKFERAGVKHYDRRNSYAQRALSAFRAVSEIVKPPVVAKPSRDVAPAGTAGGVVVAGGVFAQQAAEAGLTWWGVALIVLGTIAAAGGAYYLVREWRGA